MKENITKIFKIVIAKITEMNGNSRRLIISAIVLFFLSLAVFIQNVFYLNNVAVLTEENVLEFVNTLPNMSRIETPEPLDKFLGDKFMQDSANLSLLLCAIEENKDVDVSFSDSRGRYRIMVFSFDTVKAAAERFMYYEMAPASPDTKTPITVSRGAVIGKTGNTGNSSGEHLHLELWNPYVQYQSYISLSPYKLITNMNIS